MSRMASSQMPKSSPHTAMPPASKRSYSKVIFHTPQNLADEAAGMLIANGANGCNVAGMTKPRARAVETVALEAWFERISAAEVESLRSMLANAGMLTANSRIDTPRRIVDPGWATMWMKRFGPFHVGRKFLIAPPWHRAT